MSVHFYGSPKLLYNKLFLINNTSEGWIGKFHQAISVELRNILPPHVASITKHPEKIRKQPLNPITKDFI